MKINRCPKCGREPKVIRIKSITEYGVEASYGVEAKCHYCGLYTGYCKTLAEAVAKWNELTKGVNND